VTMPIKNANGSKAISINNAIDLKTS